MRVHHHTSVAMYLPVVDTQTRQDEAAHTWQLTRE